MTRMMMIRVVVDIRLPSGGTPEHVSCPRASEIPLRWSFAHRLSKDSEARGALHQR
jgi:hypothetical protein